MSQKLISRKQIKSADINYHIHSIYNLSNQFYCSHFLVNNLKNVSITFRPLQSFLSNAIDPQFLSSILPPTSKLIYIQVLIGMQFKSTLSLHPPSHLSDLNI